MAMENGPCIVVFPLKIVIFQSYVTNYQRVPEAKIPIYPGSVSITSGAGLPSAKPRANMANAQAMARANSVLEATKICGYVNFKWKIPRLNPMVDPVFWKTIKYVHATTRYPSDAWDKPGSIFPQFTIRL